MYIRVLLKRGYLRWLLIRSMNIIIYFNKSWWIVLEKKVHYPIWDEGINTVGLMPSKKNNGKRITQKEWQTITKGEFNKVVLKPSLSGLLAGLGCKPMYQASNKNWSLKEQDQDGKKRSASKQEAWGKLLHGQAKAFWGKKNLTAHLMSCDLNC